MNNDKVIKLILGIGQLKIVEHRGVRSVTTMVPVMSDIEVPALYNDPTGTTNMRLIRWGDLWDFLNVANINSFTLGQHDVFQQMQESPTGCVVHRLRVDELNRLQVLHSDWLEEIETSEHDLGWTSPRGYYEHPWPLKDGLLLGLKLWFGHWLTSETWRRVLRHPADTQLRAKMYIHAEITDATL
jgi:hypothetical protein